MIEDIGDGTYHIWMFERFLRAILFSIYHLRFIIFHCYGVDCLATNDTLGKS